MRRLFVVLGVLPCVLVVGVLTSGVASASFQDDKLNAPQLKAMIEGLGYETSVLNKTEGQEKYEFKVTKGGFDIPIAAEFSGSKNYIWLSVFLGESKPTNKFEEMLKANFRIQPTQFYITTKGNLMLAIALDNRSVTAPVLRRSVDKLADDAASTSELWSGG